MLHLEQVAEKWWFSAGRATASNVVFWRELSFRLEVYETHPLDVLGKL